MLRMAVVGRSTPRRAGRPPAPKSHVGQEPTVTVVRFGEVQCGSRPAVPVTSAGLRASDRVVAQRDAPRRKPATIGCMDILNELHAFFRRRSRADPLPTDPPGAEPQSSVPHDVPEALIVLLAEVLQGRGYEPRLDGRTLNLASGIILETELEELARLSPDAVRTSTRFTARHLNAFPDGLTEYQHACEGSTVDSISNGFMGWADMDLVALEDALLDSPQKSSVLRKSYDGPLPGQTLEREFILGPTVHVATLPRPDGIDHHPFCPCCLLTNSFEAFNGLLKEDRILGIRLFAAVNPDGAEVADCRVNGAEFAEGAHALRRYASTWPRRGYEYRKQYVVVRTRSAPPDASCESPKE